VALTARLSVEHGTIPPMPVVLLLAAIAILAGVVVVAIGRGGELAVFRSDIPPLRLEFATAADMATFRPPPAFFGYSAQVTDDALQRIARVVADREAELALLRRQLAALRASPGLVSSGPGSFAPISPADVSPADASSAGPSSAGPSQEGPSQEGPSPAGSRPPESGDWTESRGWSESGGWSEPEPESDSESGDWSESGGGTVTEGWTESTDWAEPGAPAPAPAPASDLGPDIGGEG
jgi:hypothetical protein